MGIDPRMPVPKEEKRWVSTGLVVGAKVTLLPVSKEEEFREIETPGRPRLVEFKCVCTPGYLGRPNKYAQMEIVTERRDLKPYDIVRIKELIRVRMVGKTMYVMVYVWDKGQYCSVTSRSWHCPRAFELCGDDVGRGCERLHDPRPGDEPMGSQSAPGIAPDDDDEWTPNLDELLDEEDGSD